MSLLHKETSISTHTRRPTFPPRQTLSQRARAVDDSARATLHSSVHNDCDSPSMTTQLWRTFAIYYAVVGASRLRSHTNHPINEMTWIEIRHDPKRRHVLVRHKGKRPAHVPNFHTLQKGQRKKAPGTSRQEENSGATDHET